jgi:hypothetical protein
VPLELESDDGALLEEELFFREGIALGWSRTDPVARARLVRNMRFISPSSRRSDEDLLEEALSLGLDRSDPVVRRRLARRMGLRLATVARRREPTDAELRALLARDAAAFTEPERVSLTQVYLSRARRGPRLEADAHSALRRLRSGAPPETLGDPSLLPSRVRLRSGADLALRFGPGFASAIRALGVGGWSGPVPSSYGLHLVRVDARAPSRPAALPAARARVRDAWLAERERELRRAAVARLRDRYEIRLAGSGAR